MSLGEADQPATPVNTIGLPANSILQERSQGGPGDSQGREKEPAPKGEVNRAAEAMARSTREGEGVEGK